MSRMTRVVPMVAIAIAGLALAGSPAAEAKHHHNHGKKSDKDDVDVCKYAAHGSDADEKNNQKPSGSGGGGKPSSDCSKVFAKWADGSVTVYISDSGAPTGFSTALSTYAGDCYSTWACSSGLTFTTSTNPADAASADITVTWGNLGSTGILGQTSTSYFAGSITSSDVVMNSNVSSFKWTLGPSQNVSGGCFSETSNGNTSSSNYDLLSVLLHEIGHSLGVSHPTSRCSTRDACYPETMNPCTDAEEFMRRTLGNGDIKSIQTNYGL